MTSPIGFCVICKHRIEENRCNAFPEGIPFEILNGKYDHTEKFKGDNGILFEPIESGDSK